MKEVAVYEAKTRLSELLAEVDRGEEFTITRRGVAVARLTGATAPSARSATVASQRQRVRGVFAELRALRGGVDLDMPLREVLDAGRD